MFDFLEEAGVLGDPADFETELVIDWPDEPPTSEASDDALIRAVRDAGGRVFVGFKEAELPHLSGTVIGSSGERRARVRPVTAATLRAGREVVRGRGGVITRPYRALPFVAATIDPEVAPELRGHPLVDYVAPPHRGHLAGSAAGPLAASAAQTTPYNVDRIRAPQAWAANRGEGPPRVWILDNGTIGGFGHHPDLPQLNPFTCLSFVENDPMPGNGPCDDHFEDFSRGHGAAVAGVAVALDNSIDVVGVAPAATHWGSIKVCDGLPGCEEGGLVDALEWLRQNNGKHIANMSLGFDSASAAFSTTVAAAWNGEETLMVAAAGNAGPVEYPAKFSQVIAVSGTEQDDGFASESAHGDEVEISAPVEVVTVSTDTDGGTSGQHGTSFAAPHVSGTALLVWTKNPGWSNQQVRDKLHGSVLDLGAPGRDPHFGFGRIDACVAVDICF